MQSKGISSGSLDPRKIECKKTRERPTDRQTGMMDNWEVTHTQKKDFRETCRLGGLQQEIVHD